MSDPEPIAVLLALALAVALPALVLLVYACRTQAASRALLQRQYDTLVVRHWQLLREHERLLWRSTPRPFSRN